MSGSILLEYQPHSYGHFKRGRESGKETFVNVPWGDCQVAQSAQMDFDGW